MTTPSATSATWASMPLSPAHTSAATWPSPRNSRSVVISCQTAASGSSGSGSEALPAARLRPSQQSPSTARSSSDLASAREAAGSAKAWGVSASVTPRHLAASTWSGDANDHASGIARRTRRGAKL